MNARAGVAHIILTDGDEIETGAREGFEPQKSS
jgi:hypothetical protein